MPLRLAILGLDLHQREWLEAVEKLRALGEIEVVGVGHRTVAAARVVADALKAGAGGTAVAAFDDLRLFLKEGGAQVLLMDRPANATVEFLAACVAQEIGILSLGPPVENLGEAQLLAGALEARTRLLYVWPRFMDCGAARHCAQADDFVRPVRFATATWLGVHYALARAMGERGLSPQPEMAVRSMSVLAWDAIGTLIRLMGLPMSVYATVRGTVASGNSFGDLSGAASITMRFAEEAAASVTLCDRVPMAEKAGEAGPGHGRDLMLWGAGGTLKLSSNAYEFRDAEGRLIDARGEGGSAGEGEAVETLREFLRQYALPASPHRGWEHGLEDIAATMEAVVVSHRTGQAESPEKFRRLRR